MALEHDKMEQKKNKSFDKYGSSELRNDQTARELLEKSRKLYDNNLKIRDLLKKNKQGHKEGWFISTIACFMRMPLISYEEVMRLQGTIIKMLESNIDCSLLLKAGLLTGGSYDRILYKKERQAEEIWRKPDYKTQMYELKQMKTTLEQNFSKGCYSKINSDLNGYPNLCIKLGADVLGLQKAIIDSGEKQEVTSYWSLYWNRLPLSLQKKAIKLRPIKKIKSIQKLISKGWLDSEIYKCAIYYRNKIEEILNISSDEWDLSLAPYGTSDDTFIFTIASSEKNYACKIINSQGLFDDYVDQPFGGNAGYIIKKCNDSKYIQFLKIHNKCLMDHEVFKVKEELKRILVAKNGYKPTDAQFNSLKQEYYTFINKIYPTHSALKELDFAQYSYFLPEQEKINLFGSIDPTLSLFALEHPSDHGLLVGRLLYDKRTNKYKIRKGSTICFKKANRCNSSDKTIDNFFGIKYKDDNPMEITRKHLEKKEIDDDNFCYYIVKRDAPVSSSTLAAHLVLGYKRNGLDCWKNYNGDTLRKYLKSIKCPPKRRVKTRFVSIAPADQK